MPRFSLDIEPPSPYIGIKTWTNFRSRGIMFTINLRNGLLGCSIFFAFVLALVAPPQTEAQVLYGSIVGNVKDSTGAVVPQVTVTVVNKETNLTRQATTDEAGGYSFTNIQTGNYSLKISQQGFKTFEQTEVS